MKKILIAVSGASGSVYASSLLHLLSRYPALQVSVVFSDTALAIWKEELGEDPALQLPKSFRLLDNHDFHVDVASGSSCADVMVILPASMGCLGRIAHGISVDLISRAADVMIKEQRKLIVVPRESPLSLIHLRNLTDLAQAGVQVIPPIPAFYTHPESIEDLVSQFTNRLLTNMGLDPVSTDFKFLK